MTQEVAARSSRAGRSVHGIDRPDGLRVHVCEADRAGDLLDARWDERAQRFNQALQSAGLPVRIAHLSSIWTVTYTQPSRYNWMLQFYLRAHGYLNPIHGMDYDPRKIEAARHVLQNSPAENLTFAQGDAREGLPAHLGSVTILDILQYFPPEEQARLLTEAASRLSPDGVLVIRSGLDTPGWRFRFTRWNDRMANRLHWMQALPVHYPTAESLTTTLTAAGLTGTLQPLHGHTPFNNWLAVFRRA